MKTDYEKQREYRLLTYNLWMDIGDNRYSRKHESRYFKMVQYMEGRCPLCALFNRQYGIIEKCAGCPLKNVGKECHIDKNNPFERFDNKWCHDRRERLQAAYEIALVAACWSIDGDGGI